MTVMLSCWDAEVVAYVLEYLVLMAALVMAIGSVMHDNMLDLFQRYYRVLVERMHRAVQRIYLIPFNGVRASAATPSDPDKDGPQRTYIPSLEELRAALANHPPTPSDTEEVTVEQPSVPLSKNKMRKLERAALRNLPPVPTTTFTDIPKYYQGRAYHGYKRSIGFADPKEGKAFTASSWPTEWPPEDCVPYFGSTRGFVLI
jgi:hypothetical protein